jgi:hypothetical protein
MKSRYDMTDAWQLVKLSRKRVYDALPDDEIDPDKRIWLDSHMLTCPECGRRVSFSLSKNPLLEFPDDFADLSFHCEASEQRPHYYEGPTWKEATEDTIRSINNLLFVRQAVRRGLPMERIFRETGNWEYNGYLLEGSTSPNE